MTWIKLTTWLLWIIRHGIFRTIIRINYKIRGSTTICHFLLRWYKKRIDYLIWFIINRSAIHFCNFFKKGYFEARYENIYFSEEYDLNRTLIAKKVLTFYDCDWEQYCTLRFWFFIVCPAYFFAQKNESYKLILSFRWKLAWLRKNIPQNCEKNYH